jgi:hypothetical protein
VLDIDNQATVQLEWLIADQREKFSARRWSAINRGLAASLPELPASVARDFLAARAPEVLIQALPEIAFPEVLYAAALHVVTGSMKAVKAASALQQLIPVCPGIVERSLVLAAVVSRATHL